MVSPEFRAAVADQNVLLVRIMLKDSLILDPTFRMFNELYEYSRAKISALLVPYDHEKLENDPGKWDTDVMNHELVLLIGNFSETRINHLKQVIRTVMHEKVNRIGRQRAGRAETSFQNRDGRVVRKASPMPPNTYADMAGRKKERQGQALARIAEQGKIIQKLLEQSERQNGWKVQDIEKMEIAATVILKQIKVFKENK